ncbi:unnamed protein product, partial [Rotaria socialis]
MSAIQLLGTWAETKRGI